MGTGESFEGIGNGIVSASSLVVSSACWIKSAECERVDPGSGRTRSYSRSRTNPCFSTAGACEGSDASSVPSLHLLLGLRRHRQRHVLVIFVVC